MSTATHILRANARARLAYGQCAKFSPKADTPVVWNGEQTPGKWELFEALDGTPIMAPPGTLVSIANPPAPRPTVAPMDVTTHIAHRQALKSKDLTRAKSILEGHKQAHQEAA